MKQCNSKTQLKRIIFFAVLLCGIMVFVTCLMGYEKKKLSELSENKLIRLLENEEISIPEGMDIATIRKILIGLEEDPMNENFGFSNPLVVDFIEELREFVVDYYNIRT